MSKDLRDVLRERARRQAEEERANASAEAEAREAEARAAQARDAQSREASAGDDAEASASEREADTDATPIGAPAANASTDVATAISTATHASVDHSAVDHSAIDRRAVDRDEESVLAPLRRPIVLAAMLFTFALGVYLRPMMVPEATGPTASGAPGATVAELERLAGRSGGITELPSAAELSSASSGLAAALLDPANRATIQVITYRDRASMVPYAEDTVAHLVASGFRAMGPLRVGENLVVLAEAAPTVDELAALRDAIAVLPDANGKDGQFSDALVRNIDDLIDRRTH